MPEDRRSRRLKDVSHLFLSGNGGDRPGGGTGSFVDICVTGDEHCRGFLAAGFSSSLASRDVNVTLIETGLSLPNAGYYFGLEAEVYLAPALGRSECIDLMRSPSFRYVYAARPAALPDGAAGFAFPDNPHIVINVFDYTGLSGYGAIPADIREIPARFNPDGKKDERRGLILFDGAEPGTDPARIVSSFIETTGSTAVLIASGRGEASKVPDISGVEVGMMGIPGDLGRTLAIRMPPSGSFFSAMAARVIWMTGPRQEGKTPNAAVQR
ncbi:MAG: hypothetical protein KAV42_02620 [Candidatus Krumholzibacteria bacterium]|nr:hypothetical protein [Candidatus Krumholzibacteria bacterium]